MHRYIYTLIYSLLLPLVIIYALLKAFRRRELCHLKQVIQRLFLSKNDIFKNSKKICVHAASVGEINAARLVIEDLIKYSPNLHVVITCVTVTGYKYLQSLYAKSTSIQYFYLPYDLPCIISIFLRKIKPNIALIMETELWPNYIHNCHKLGIPIILANARLSEKSFLKYTWFPTITQTMLQEIDLIAVQTSKEADRFRFLKARSGSVKVTGSIKFSTTTDSKLMAKAFFLNKEWGLEKRPVWIAASIHNREISDIISVHQKILKVYPNCFLIMVPRHPEYFQTAYKLCKDANFKIARYSSKVSNIQESTQVLLVDSIGELLLFYALAQVAFVGGSLVPVGGHNLLEAAVFGKPILSGPHLFNFLEISVLLKKYGALQEIKNVFTLTERILYLISFPEKAKYIGKSGLEVVRANQGALEKTTGEIKNFLV